MRLELEVAVRKTDDDGAIGGGGKRRAMVLLALVSLLLALVMVGVTIWPVQAGLCERVEYREVVGETATLAYPLILATYTPGPTLTPYPTPCWPAFLCWVR